MSNAKICDNCKKLIKIDSWSGYNYEELIIPKTVKKINKQQVMVQVRISLKCDNELDLCNKCAFSILEKVIK